MGKDYGLTNDWRSGTKHFYDGITGAGQFHASWLQITVVGGRKREHKLSHLEHYHGYFVFYALCCGKVTRLLSEESEGRNYAEVTFRVKDHMRAGKIRASTLTDINASSQ